MSRLWTGWGGKACRWLRVSGFGVQGSGGLGVQGFRVCEGVQGLGIGFQGLDFESLGIN